MKLAILGTRGIPARHGGFETFAEQLAQYLVAKGWQVTVYCQDDHGKESFEASWKGVRLVHIPVLTAGALGTVIFDWKATGRAAQEDGLVLTLGYNTALFSLAYRLKGRLNLINMDGIEWKRQKWSLPERTWLYLNEWAGCLLANHLIADHPEIKKHLLRRVSEKKISMIPYGADSVEDSDRSFLKPYGVTEGDYTLVIARPEPENSVLEIVTAFSQKRRGISLVILGQYEPDKNTYHNKVMAAAGKEIRFIGAVYEKQAVQALRFHARLYIHGHTVGGTNPALVEALGAGMAVLAHDNRFNRWVAGQGAHYFQDQQECADKLDIILSNDQELKKMKTWSSSRHKEEFTWDSVMRRYGMLLQEWIDRC